MRWMFLSLFVLLIGACKKDTDNPQTNMMSSYLGVWELRSSNGGLSGQNTYPSGQGNYLSITQDSVILSYHHNRVDASTYHVEKDTTYFFGEPRLMDQLVARENWSFFFTATNNTLTTYIGTPALDGVSAVYVRIQQTD
jgi:hypothetical protein